MRHIKLALVALVLSVGIGLTHSSQAAALTCLPPMCITPPTTTTPDDQSTTQTPPVNIVLPFAAKDDGDGVPATTENAAPNTGDNNYDGALDSEQSEVASTPNPNDQAQPNSYVTLEVLPNDNETPSNWVITSFVPVSPADFATKPSTADNYPVGMFEVNLYNGYLDSILSACYRSESENCFDDNAELIESESTATVRLLFDRVMDHSDWTVQQYSYWFNAYTNYSAYAVVRDEVVGFLRTTITWTLTDGGNGDDDGYINSIISDQPNAYVYDPIGPAAPFRAATTPAVTVVSTPAITATPAAAPAAPQLANTGVSPLITILAASLIVATIAVSRVKRTV